MKLGPVLQVDAVIFDMDGVLVESKKAWFNTLNSALREFGLPEVDWSTFIKHFGQSIEEDARTFFKGKKLTREDINELYGKYFPKFIDMIEPTYGARRVLERILKAGIKTGCVTNTHKALALKILRRVNLLDFLMVVVGGDEVTSQKPDPEPLLRALTHLGILPRKACYVGDTIYDIRTAINAGCIPVGFKINSEISINSLEDLLYLLSV